MLTQKKVFIFALVFFVLSAFASYSYFSVTSAGQVDQSSYKNPASDNMVTSSDIAPNDPKTEECPLNGQLYSKAQRALWDKRRPLGIMVQNNAEARPQSGLSSADVLYEVVAEGGITRFLTIFYCQNPKIVGSVRSARVYYITLLQGYGNYPLYAHVGGANTPGPADALGEIGDLGWVGYNDLNQFSVPFPIFWRDPDRLPGRATEHTVYADTNKLWQYAAEKRDLTNVDEEGISWDEDFAKWTFKDDAKAIDRGNVNFISFGFWEQFASDYNIIWKYNKEANLYQRENGGKEHIDFNTKKQLTGKDIVVIFADERAANDGYENGQHLLYDLQGTGDALIFQDGQAIEGTWNKKKPTTNMTFSDENGKEVELVRGQVWVEILPTGNKVSYGKTMSEITKPATDKSQKSGGSQTAE
ncbi:hypothetical protein A3H86_02535 [Candidatus Roizmanbacteria bacterium RIFCSPLOWO2_02_FULL_41_9]|uniref:DUF3048 domain-containing protein n=1 Tax=Candidatus Roizmanbacteria bacterium RIFCSPLOWO2_02_FULL_41_9 TaxID=1802077 RepID=A0A1F7JRL6_9BACT|nr:MAG: hypothetical protein A3H86_02535 [Candidatus Roizmanbacteria bacterium RIFCSPLOWO2_02_FULL_41_9]